MKIDFRKMDVCAVLCDGDGCGLITRLLYKTSDGIKSVSFYSTEAEHRRIVMEFEQYTHEEKIATRTP